MIEERQIIPARRGNVPAGSFHRITNLTAGADCQSATQQTASLRYVGDGSRVGKCADSAVRAPARGDARPAAWIRGFGVRGFCLAVVGAWLAWPQEAGAVTDARDYAVLVSASVQATPPQITLSWAQDTFAVPTSYNISRKSPTSTSWTFVRTLSGTETSFVDSTVAAGVAYEYQVLKRATGYLGYGYVLAGVELPLTEARGKVVFIVDNTYAADLATELARLQQDLVGDGWQVLRHDVDRNATPASVKALIVADYASDPTNVRSVFLFGHVPVPYSGDIAPDGHPNHTGAWPADVYYGDVTATWADASVTDTTATEVRHRNVPGDGKFDVCYATTLAELEVGRVDLANLPSFALPERELLRQYLNKDHNFRHKLVTAQARGLVCDNFGVASGEAFAATGWRNFAAFFGASNVMASSTWFPALANESYLWAYGCGGGTYTSASGIGSTADFAVNDPQAVFTFQFGSYFGDWDSTDNFLRAGLATPTYTLTAAWAGRPHWFVHRMALSGTIGESTRLSQNNTTASPYRQLNAGSQQVHTALMGDPTLRMHPVAPPTDVIAAEEAGQAALTWTASAEPALGYFVYRATDSDGPFTRVSAALVTGTWFRDPVSGPGDYVYQVRAIRLEQSASGSYYNSSQGAFASASVTAAALLVTPAADQTRDASEAWTFALPEVSGGCGSVTVLPLSTTTNFTCGNSFVATRVWQVTDACGTVLLATNTVTVVDMTAPVLSLPTDQGVELGLAWSFGVPVAQDAGGTVTVAVLNTVTNTACGNTFSATRTWRATDACGNAAGGSQAVIVSDTTAPTLTSPANQTVELGSAWTFGTPVAQDAGGIVTVDLLSTITNAACGNTLSTTRTWRATDPCGNATQGSQTITVTDTTAPTLTSPANQTVELGSAWGFGLPVAEDAGGAVTVAVLSTVTNAACGDTFSATRTWRATDACGNTAQGSQTVTVSDTTAPTLTSPANQTVELGSAWVFGTPTAQDAGGPVTVQVLSTVTNAACGNTFSATRVWQATDACGNATQSSQTVTVRDTTAPILVVAASKTAVSGTAWSFDAPTATDISGVATIAILSTVTNGSVVTRTWTATDPCGNQATGSQAVTVQAAGPPTVTIVASDASASEVGDTGTYLITRTGSTVTALTVTLSFSGTAKNGTDYTKLATSITIPAGSSSVSLVLKPLMDKLTESTETAIATVQTSKNYVVGTSSNATINIANK